MGKERSRRNAIKHGIFAAELLLPSERSSNFNKLLVGLRKHYKPKGTLEILLVERLAEILWRRYRLIRAERGEIQKGTEFLEIDEKRNQDDEAASIREFDLRSGGIVQKISNPKILESCVAQLQRLKSWIEESGLDEDSDMAVLIRIYGTSRPADGERTLIDAYSDWLSVVRSNKSVDEKNELPSSEDCKLDFLNVLNREIKRLKRYRREHSMIESKRNKIELLRRSVPDGPQLERLLRYDASLERSLYRTLNQLERLQRIRKGQLVPPIFDVNVS